MQRTAFDKAKHSGSESLVQKYFAVKIITRSKVDTTSIHDNFSLSFVVMKYFFVDEEKEVYKNLKLERTKNLTFSKKMKKEQIIINKRKKKRRNLYHCK